MNYSVWNFFNFWEFYSPDDYIELVIWNISLVCYHYDEGDTPNRTFLYSPWRDVKKWRQEHRNLQVGSI